MGDLFSNISFACLTTGLIILLIGLTVKMYDLESKIGNTILFIAVVFGCMSGITAIISIWLTFVFRGI